MARVKPAPWALKVARRAKAALKKGRRGTAYVSFLDNGGGVREVRIGWNVIAKTTATEIARALTVEGWR